MAQEYEDFMRRGGESVKPANISRFIEAAKTSHIPADFIVAATNVEKQFLASCSPAEPGKIFRLWQEIAYRLVEREFGTSAEARYAFVYGSTVSTVKNWQARDEIAASARNELQDDVNNVLPLVREVLGAGEDFTPESVIQLARDTDPEEVEYDQLTEDEQIIHNIVTDIRDADKKITGVERRASAFKEAARVWIFETTRLEEIAREIDPLLRKITREREFDVLYTPTDSKGLAQVRAYLEDYFQAPQKQARLKLLAMDSSRM